MTDTAAATVSRNVTVTLVVRAFYMVTRFLIPPFVLSHIGLEQYGLWTALFLAVGYIGMSVVGFSGAYVKFTAEFHAAGDHRRINELLSTGLAITIPVYGLAFTALWLYWRPLYAATGLSAALEPEARPAALLVIGSFLIGIALWGFADLLNGLQRIDTMQTILMITYATETALIFVLVGMGRGVRGLAEAFVARTVLSVALAAWVCFRTCHWLRISPRFVSQRAFQSLFAFGGVVQIQSTLSIVLSTVDRALAVPLLGSSAAAVFDLAKKLPSAISDLTGSFFTALMPAASHFSAGDDGSRETVRSLYLKGSRYSAMLSAVLCAVPVCFARPLLETWIGRSLPGMVECAVMFGLAMQVHLLTGTGTSVLRGIGRLSGDFSYLIPNMLFLAAALAAVHHWQNGWTLIGIAAAVSLATILAAIVALLYIHRVLEIEPGEYLRTVLMPCLAPYGVAAALALPLHILTGDTTRWQTACLVIAASALHAAASAASLWIGALSAEEKCSLRSKCGHLRRRVAYVSQ